MARTPDIVKDSDRYNPGLIVDCFAGGGGASTGIERAFGRSPDYAINHSAAAIAMHEANHPETEHLITDIWDVSPEAVAAGRKLGFLWASPDCKHFSKASGGAPKDRNIRDLAWNIVKWALLPKNQRPDVIAMENVEEFRTWGPIDDEGRVIKGMEGIIFEQWLRQLKDLGYKVQFRELRACDFGAPTIRKRFFLVARCDGLPIIWPKPTHGAPDHPAVKSGKLKPYRTAAECIDWSLPCPSIFDSKVEIKEKHGLQAKRPLAFNTMARIARGMKRYVLEAKNPFIVNLTHGARIENACEPIKTITGARRGEKAIVAPSITRFNTGATGQVATDPLATITANSWIKRPGGAAPLGIIAPSLMSLKGTTRRHSATDAPHPTVLAGGGHSALVAPSLVSVAHGNSGGRREYQLSETLGVVTAGGIAQALAAPVLTYAQQGGANRDVRAPHHTICANRKDQNSVFVAGMAQIGYGERTGQAPRIADLEAPLGTVVATSAKHAPFAAFLAQHNLARNGAHPGRAANQPLATVTTTGSQQNPIAAFFAKYYGTGDGAKLDEPSHTVTARDRFGHVEAEISAPPFEPHHEKRAREVAEFLRNHGAWEGGEFVTLAIDGDTFVVVDIGLRMLTPRELFNAQGFPPDYVIEGTWSATDGDWRFNPFTKDTQVSCCGNSVCPDIAAAIASANVPRCFQTQRKESA